MSNKFKVAHVHVQGVDLIIIPLASSFESKPSDDQHETIAALQACAQSAGLAGDVVPVWLRGRSMRFIAHQNYHRYFQSLNWNFIQHNINKELTCG